MDPALNSLFLLCILGGTIGYDSPDYKIAECVGASG